MTEKEFEAYLNYRINMLGGESGFEMIVASGKRGALPHGRATDKPIEKGEIVTVDFSSRYKGYLCDITRNFSIGEPEDKAKQYHDILLETHITSAKKIKAGVKANEPHNTACEVLAKYDISKYFIHSLGHSFGLEIHEPPFISTSGNGQLKKNDIVTVEPGIYIPGWGGMRLEDDYLITQTGAERLTESIEQKLFIV